MPDGFVQRLDRTQQRPIPAPNQLAFRYAAHANFVEVKGPELIDITGLIPRIYRYVIIRTESALQISGYLQGWPNSEFMTCANKIFLFLYVGFAVIAVAIPSLNAQTPARDTSTVQTDDFWAAAKLVVEQRKKANEPLVKPGQSDLDLNQVCLAAHQEMQRRGIVAEPRKKAVGIHTINFSDVTSVEAPFSSAPNSKSNPHIAPIVSSTSHPGLADTEAQPRIHESARFAIDRVHANCFDGTEFPPAEKCQACHPGHYEEWSVSSHAYAQLSPVFNAFSNKLNEITNGTIGDFCIRCHTPIGMAQNDPMVKSNLDRTPVVRQGVTCVVCHRVNQNWGKISGRQALVGGGLDKPVYGPLGNDVLQQVIANPSEFGILTSGHDPSVKGRVIHQESVPFFALTTSATCASCHDVFAPNGFRLEDIFSEFKTSPAAREKHQNCQDCHMGVSPGIASGYSFAPIAKIGNASTPPRKRTNHMMAGPDYSIIHPGIFPHNPKAVKEEFSTDDELSLGLATMREWLSFDHLAGWGTEAFERNLNENHYFPEPWKSAAKRFRARDILDDQFRLLHKARVASHQLLSVGYQLGNVVSEGVNRKGLHFKIKVSNGTDGHGVPSGFDAERLVFLRTTVHDRNGKLVFVSGDLDPNGDVRDSHSSYVHNGKLPLDRQLFSLQSRFLTRNVRGGEREQILNIAYSLDPLPYFRPATRPFTVLGRPVSARKHKQGIEVGGHRWAEYTIKPSQLTGCGPYSVNVQLIAAMVPINLVQAISSVGFDYGMSPRQVADAIVDGHILVHSRNAILRADE